MWVLKPEILHSLFLKNLTLLKSNSVNSQIEIFQSEDRQIQVQVRFEGDTVWLSQKMMAELYEKDTDTIGLHLKNIYREQELSENSTTELF